MPLNKRTHRSTKKSSNVFEQIFSSTKNLALFRYKPLERVERCQSQLQLNSEPSSATPMCLGRSWLKKRLARPISVDFECVDNDQLPLWLHRVGTRRLFLLLFSFIRVRERTRVKMFSSRFISHLVCFKSRLDVDFA